MPHHLFFAPAAVPLAFFLLYLGFVQAPGGALNLLIREKNEMGKSQPKRRGNDTQPSHQVTKAAAKKRKKVDWTRIALIIVGIMIVISMILSMVR